MALRDDVYSFIKSNYKPDEPIFLSELNIPGIKEGSVRQQMMKLTEEGKIKRYIPGVYFIPTSSKLFSSSTLSIDEVIEKKYMLDGDSRCGYETGIYFANLLGLTTQVPAIYNIYTNKATTDYRETQVSGVRVILRRPHCEITNENATILQFLDLLKEVVRISEVEGNELTNRLIWYMNLQNITVESMKPYLPYYPKSIYQNMFEVGISNGVFAQQ